MGSETDDSLLLSKDMSESCSVEIISLCLFCCDHYFYRSPVFFTLEFLMFVIFHAVFSDFQIMHRKCTFFVFLR